MTAPTKPIELSEEESDLILTAFSMWRNEWDTGDDWSDVEALKARIEALWETP